MEKMDHYVMPGNRMRYNCNFHVIPAKTLCHNYDLAVIPALDAGIQGFSFKSFERLETEDRYKNRTLDPGVKHRDDGWSRIPGCAGMDDEQL